VSGAASDLLIERVETVLLDVPLRRPHRLARASTRPQPVCLAFIHTAGRASGLGAGVVPGEPWRVASRSRPCG
jgi:muconate cycloisomerase